MAPPKPKRGAPMSEHSRFVKFRGTWMTVAKRNNILIAEGKPLPSEAVSQAAPAATPAATTESLPPSAPAPVIDPDRERPAAIAELCVAHGCAELMAGWLRENITLEQARERVDAAGKILAKANPDLLRQMGFDPDGITWATARARELIAAGATPKMFADALFNRL